MVDFARMAVTTARLIDANGRAVTLTQQGSTPVDPNQPWRGNDTPVRATVSGQGVFTSYESSNPDNTKRLGQMMLFAANADTGLELEDFDTILDGARTWKIVSAAVIGPADTRVLYKFEVER